MRANKTPAPSPDRARRSNGVPLRREFARAGSHVFVIERIPRRRSMRLSVDINGTLRVLAPKTLKQTEIVDFVSQNLSWLAARLAKVERLQQKFPPHCFRAGERFPYLGEEHFLQIEPAQVKRPRVTRVDTRLLVQLPAQDWKDSFEWAPMPALGAVLRSFYKSQAEIYLLERTRHWSTVTGLQPEHLIFRAQKTLWGSCNSRKKMISLNWKLLAAPEPVIDYVIVHELCHLRHPNHSRKFWDLVETFAPNHKSLRTWLKDKQFCFDFLEKESDLFISKLY